jgi:hypothetical protein
MQEVGERTTTGTKSFFMFDFNEKLCFCYYATSLPLLVALSRNASRGKFMGKKDAKK